MATAATPPPTHTMSQAHGNNMPTTYQQRRRMNQRPPPQTKRRDVRPSTPQESPWSTQPRVTASSTPPPSSRITSTAMITPPTTPPQKRQVNDRTLAHFSSSSQGSSSHASSSFAATSTPTTHASSPSQEPLGGTSIAIEYSYHACVCLQEEDLQGALTWYQRALIVYQTEAAEAKDPPLGIVDTCNAAATLHNMGAVYNALQQGDAALQCYHDAEQLYRECRERLDTPTKVALQELEDQETVCLTALIAETLHHRASIYETSVWDSVAALECHEACVQLLTSATTTRLETATALHVTVVDDVYFQQECILDVQIQWLTASYKALAKLYRQSDTPQDGLVALEAWKTILETNLSTTKDPVAYRASLAECYQQLAEFYFTLEDMTAGIESLHSAMSLQLDLVNTNSSPEAMASAISKVLSKDLLQAMNSMGQAKEDSGFFEEAVLCYEKILLLVSRYLGEDHWQVAEALVKIGRVMECQGNVAGGLDLYHAAHTIYQAAVKNVPSQEVEDTDADRALSTRAATESVVRIANVLMSQKRWQEAVDFLRELPQTKVPWLDDDVTDDALASTSLVTVSPPSVDQAIVFRELGRAYMGMGALARAKQCLLESARRLEGTDHEEDVFELLMHVEFCQNQERKAAVVTDKNRLGRLGVRSRSRSRARSRSRSSRILSKSSSDGTEKGRITKDTVAAVLSSHAPGTSAGERRNVGPMPVSPTSPGRTFNKGQGLSPPRSDTPVKSPSPALSEPLFPTSPTWQVEAAVDDDPPLLPHFRANSGDTNERNSDTSTPPPPPSDELHRNNEDGTRSLGSLESKEMMDTGSLVKATASESPKRPNISTRALTPLPTNIDAMFDDATPFDPMVAKDSFQVQRAKDIILKRVKQENDVLSTGTGRREDAHLDDGQSDVVSSVLMGLDIDIDLPPSSPTSKDGHSYGGGSFRKTFADIVVTESASTDKPFDEKTVSHSSSRESSAHHRRGFDAASSGQVTRTITTKEKRQFHFLEDDVNPSQASAYISASFSDLTSAFGQSSTASINVNEQPSQPKGSTGYLPPLLQKKSESVSPLNIVPPPPPPLPSSPPSQIETATSPAVLSSAVTPKMSTSTKHSQEDVITPSSLASEKDEPTKISPRDEVFPEFSTRRRLTRQEPDYNASPKSDTQPPSGWFDADYHEADDDASSDPFEGYEDFDADDGSDSETSPSYSGDSESEQGYTRFAREDFSSGGGEESVHSENDEDPLDENNLQHRLQGKVDAYKHPIEQTERRLNHNIIIYDDSRQPSQRLDSQPDFFSGRRDSPVSSTTQGYTFGSFASDPVATPERGSKIMSGSRENDDDTRKESKESNSFSTPSSKLSSKIKSSPGNRIVRALSQSIRLRRKSKASRKLSKQLKVEKMLADAAGEGSSAKNVQLEQSSVNDETTPERAGNRSLEDNVSLTDAAIEELEGDDTLGGPIKFISMSSPSYDDSVSQITFTLEDYNAKSHSSNSQWWGQLDGWFPNFHQAVEAAEGFLSAKAIHAQMKSQPLDFDSEDEEDSNDDLVVRDTSALPVASSTSRSELEGACSPIHNTFFHSPHEASHAKRNRSATKNDHDRSGNAFKVPGSSTPQALSPTHSESMFLTQSKNDIIAEIKLQEKLLAQYEVDALNDDNANHKVANTLFRLSILFLQNQQLEEALKSTNEALRIQKYLGDSADATRSLHLLADIFVRKGEYESALSCYAEVQETELELYGYIHEETANTLNRIGGVLARQSKFRQAMEKHEEALRILKECHGEELRHPLVSQTLIHIGAVYYRERNSLATVRTNSEDYKTFIEVGMLEVIGRAHEDRGSYKMAISFFEEKLQCLNQKRKDDKASREDIAATLNSLGMLSCRAGIFMEAIDYYDRALEVQKQIGCDKMQLATARVLTATVQFHLGYFQKALCLLQDALTELQAEAGDDHETVAATWFQIGVVQVALCEYDSGMDALEEALRIQNKLLGKIHPATLRTRREIGNMYAIYESELDAAFAQFHDILTLQRRIHGHKHPNVAETLHSLGCAYARKGDFANAIKTLEECYYMRIDFLGADHPLQATTLHEIAEIHRKRHRFRKAKHICDAVLDIRKESLSERHIDVARTLATKASCLVALGDYNSAMKCLREALPMAEQAVGEGHPAVADILVHMGELHLRKCHFEEAKEWINKALQIYEMSNLDEDHPLLKDAYAMMERVDRDEMLCV